MARLDGQNMPSVVVVSNSTALNPEAALSSPILINLFLRLKKKKKNVLQQNSRTNNNCKTKLNQKLPAAAFAWPPGAKIYFPILNTLSQKNLPQITHQHFKFMHKSRFGLVLVFLF